MKRPSNIANVEIYKRTMCRCAYCGKIITEPGDATYDHIKPKSKNGSSEVDNLYLSCADCNAIKSNLSLDEFRNKLKTVVKEKALQDKNTNTLYKFGLLKFEDKPITFFYEKITPEVREKIENILDELNEVNIEETKTATNEDMCVVGDYTFKIVRGMVFVFKGKLTVGNFELKEKKWYWSKAGAFSEEVVQQLSSKKTAQDVLNYIRGSNFWKKFSEKELTKF